MFLGWFSRSFDRWTREIHRFTSIRWRHHHSTRVEVDFNRNDVHVGQTNIGRRYCSLDSNRERERDPFIPVVFYTLITASGHKISATPLHLISVVSSNGRNDAYLPTREIQLGDQLFVDINGQVRPSRVMNITLEVKRGYFAPLTTAGNNVNELYRRISLDWWISRNIDGQWYS